MAVEQMAAWRVADPQMRHSLCGRLGEMGGGLLGWGSMLACAGGAVLGAGF